MANNQVSTDVRQQLQKMEGQFTSALPPHIPVERFMRVVMTAVNGNPDLISADRSSLFEACLKAAQDGLLPDGRDGALVLFGKKATWMPMIGGILKKVRNSGMLLSISAYVVYENDKFTYRLGDDERIDHEPALENAGAPKLVYAIARTKDGGIYREVMTLSQVEKVRQVSRAKSGGPWKDWWDEMAKKTVLRRLSKRLPTSADLDDLIRRDDDLYDFSGKRAESAGFTPIENPLKDDVSQVAKTDTKTIEHDEDGVVDEGIEDEDVGPGMRTLGGKKIEQPAIDTAATKSATADSDHAANPYAADEAKADRVISAEGVMTKDRGDRLPEMIVDHRLDDYEPVFTSFDGWATACAENAMPTKFSPTTGQPLADAKRRTETASDQVEKTDMAFPGDTKPADAVKSETAPKQQATQQNAPTSSSRPKAAPGGAPYASPGEYVEYMTALFDNATSEAKITEEWASTRTDRNSMLDSANIDDLTKKKAAALKRVRAGG